MSDARPATRRGGFSAEPISGLLVQEYQDNRLADYQARREILQARVRQERESYSLRQQMGNAEPPSPPKLIVEHRLEIRINWDYRREPRDASRLPRTTKPKAIPAILPGDGIRALLEQTPGIWEGNMEEGISLFEELMRELICRRFGWVKSLVVEDVLMRELDGFLASGLLMEN